MTSTKRGSYVRASKASQTGSVFARVRIAASSIAVNRCTYSSAEITRLGAGVARDADSYRYLAESIRVFPDQEALAGMLRAAGFERVAWRNLSGGIVAIHTGWRL